MNKKNKEIERRQGHKDRKDGWKRRMKMNETQRKSRWMEGRTQGTEEGRT